MTFTDDEVHKLDFALRLAISTIRNEITRQPDSMTFKTTLEAFEKLRLKIHDGKLPRAVISYKSGQ